VGAYTYSHGLEYVVHTGQVTTGESLRQWCAGALAYGAGRTDGSIFVAAWRSADQGDVSALVDLNDFATALRPTAELALESAAQGRAFLQTVNAVWGHPQMLALADALAAASSSPSAHGAYPVVVAAAAAWAGVPCLPALVAYLHAFAANLVSAGVRLVPLGQTAGQKALHDLEDIITKTATAAMDMPFEDIGAASPMIDWASMAHETQYTRLFRS
jgi:urease accessory protein